MQIEILSAFIRRAKDVHIAFPYASENKENLGLEDLRYPSELYYDVKNSIRKLRETYPDIEERITVVASVPEGISPEILKIEDELFQSPKKPAVKEAEHIHLAEAGTVEEELRYVAEEILSYIYEKGYRFSDIAVLAGNLEEYAAKAEKIFDEYRLTYFLDRKQKIKNHPLLLFVESALMAVKTNFRYEELMQHLKSVYIFPDLTDSESKEALENEIGILDIYALEHGLQGKRKYREREEMSAELREILEDLFELDKQLRRKGGFSDKLEALRQYLDQRKVAANLDKQVAMFEQNADWIRHSEYRQAKEKLWDYFEEMAEFMQLDAIVPENEESVLEEEMPDLRKSQENMELADFISVLLTGMQELEYAAAPPVPDQIVVGSLEHTRLSKTKIVFAIGLNEGSVPSVQPDSGFYSDWERQSLKQSAGQEFPLAEDCKTSIFKAQLTIFMSLLNATEHLYFSYATGGVEGKSQRPANLFYQINRMFPHNPVKNLSTWWKEHQRVTYPQPTLHSFMKQLHEGGRNSDFLRIYQSLCDSEVAPAMQRLILPTFAARENISPKIAGELYQKQRRMSVSRLESYSSCPFLHFIRYGLRAREIVPYQAARVDMGVFLHKVMETVFSLCQKRNKPVYALTEAEYEAILQEAIRAGLDTDKRSIFEGTARNRFLAKKLSEVADRVIRTTQKQMQRGEMSFYKEEIRFRRENMAGLRFFTEDGEEFYLEGVIDRMDTSKEGDTVYFTILDYKTGEHDLDYTKIFYGLQLQLLIYLQAGEQYLQTEYQNISARPVSAAYFHMKNPLFGQADLGGEAIPQEEDFLKAMRLKGVFVAETLTKMDKGLESENQSLVMNVRLKNDGTPYSNAMVLSEEELNQLEGFAKEKAEEIAGEIWQGRAAVHPYYYGKTTPCSYCSYAGICKVDLKENPYRFLQKKEKSDLLAKKKENDQPNP